MRTFHGLWLAVACGLTACSGSGESAAPDAGSDAAVTQDSGGDTGQAAVTLLDTTPADAALHVGLLTPVKLHYSGSLLPSSVSATSVTLTAPNATLPLAATVAYDDPTRTITLTPKSALTSNGVYRVAMSSLLAADSSPVANAGITFTTVYNSYTDAINYDAVGTTIIALQNNTLDAQGRLIQRATMAKGVDGVFKTGDDVPTKYASIAFSPGKYRTTNFTGAGTDNAWFTADDVIGGYSDSDNSTNGLVRSISYSGPGVDTLWLSADDVIGTFYEYAFTPGGRETYWVNFATTGADKMPFTADDTISGRYADTWTTTSGQRITYSGPGADATWKTSDDVIGGVQNDTLDAEGRITALSFLGKGADNTWLTADDTITSLWSNTYDSNGLVTRVTNYSGAGADGTWLTLDDVVSVYYAHTNDTNGATLTVRAYSAGPDGKWFTGDDVATYVEHYNTAL